MNSYNPEKLARNESIRLEARGPKASRDVLQSEAELSIDDSFDLGGDPYNSTGRHVIMKSQLKRED